VADLDRIRRLRSVIAKIGPITLRDLEDGDSPLMLQIEAVLARAASAVERLPREVRELLPRDSIQGLIGARNVAAHGYAQLNPEMTVDIMRDELPSLLDKVEAALLEL
jgi:uncharacterized protein with HEPN domain